MANVDFGRSSSNLSAERFASGDPFGYFHLNQAGPVQHVVYRGKDGHIYELFTRPDGWDLNNLTKAAQAPLASGDPFGYLHQGNNGLVQHVMYRDRDGHIQELFTRSDGWVFNTLTKAAQAPLASGDPFGYLHQGNNGLVQHVVYRDRDGHIQELYSFRWLGL